MFNWLTSLTDWRGDLGRKTEDFVICRISKQVTNGKFSSPASSLHEWSWNANIELTNLNWIFVLTAAINLNEITIEDFSICCFFLLSLRFRLENIYLNWLCLCSRDDKWRCLFKLSLQSKMHFATKSQLFVLWFYLRLGSEWNGSLNSINDHSDQRASCFR